MTNRSISVPADWPIRTAHGRDDETNFEFEFNLTGISPLPIQLHGWNSANHETPSELSVNIADGDGQREFAVDSYLSETAVLTVTKRLVIHGQLPVIDSDLLLEILDFGPAESVIDGAYLVQTRIESEKSSEGSWRYSANGRAD